MICLRCRDLHAGNDLSLHDGGISLTLGDCPKGGARHEWRPGRFVLDVPYIVDAGDYRSRTITMEEARAFVHGPLVASCLRVEMTSRWLSGLLDMPLIHRKNPMYRMDIGDKALAPLARNQLQRNVDMTKWVLGKDYDIFEIEKVA